MPAFKLSSGILVTKQPLNRTLSRKPYITGRAKASDGNIQKLLNLRFDPEYAIHAAVDYGVQNLNNLTSAKYQIHCLKNDGEKAKIIYLCHHLGVADAKKFINNTMSADRAHKLLKDQVGSVVAEHKAKRFGGDYLKAHRDWLKEYINECIKLPRHMCDNSAAEKIRDLITITEVIRRK